MPRVYERVANDLRERITSSALEPGSRLPSEVDLAAQYQVSRLTIRHSLSVLQAEGLLEKRHGLGTFVSRPHPRITYANDRDRWPTINEAISHTKIAAQEVKADDELAQFLNVPPGTCLLEHRYLARHGDAPPHVLTRAYLPRQRTRRPFPDSPPSPWADDLRELVTTSGTLIDHSTERLTARHPTSEEADTLNISATTPVLVIHRQLIDTTGAIAEAAILTCPGSRTEARYTTPPLP